MLRVVRTRWYAASLASGRAGLASKRVSVWASGLDEHARGRIARLKSDDSSEDGSEDGSVDDSVDDSVDGSVDGGVDGSPVNTRSARAPRDRRLPFAAVGLVLRLAARLRPLLRL